MIERNSLATAENPSRDPLASGRATDDADGGFGAIVGSFEPVERRSVKKPKTAPGFWRLFEAAK